MKFVNYISYTSDVTKVEAIRPLHRVYAQKLMEEGKIVIAGPFEDGAGALMVYEAENLRAAEGLAEADPYAKNGVWVKFEIHPWHVLGANRTLLPG